MFGFLCADKRKRERDRERDTHTQTERERQRQRQRQRDGDLGGPSPRKCKRVQVCACQSLSLPQKHSHTNTHTPKYTWVTAVIVYRHQIKGRGYTHTHTCTHTHICIHINIHAHTHTQTSSPPPPPPLPPHQNHSPAGYSPKPSSGWAARPAPRCGSSRRCRDCETCQSRRSWCRSGAPPGSYGWPGRGAPCWGTRGTSCRTRSGRPWRWGSHSCGGRSKGQSFPDVTLTERVLYALLGLLSSSSLSYTSFGVIYGSRGNWWLHTVFCTC